MTRKSNGAERIKRSFRRKSQKNVAHDVRQTHVEQTTMVALYRAIRSKEMRPEIFEYWTTRRVPGNIPYLVDNLWEWLRPESFPSRRRIACASPTPALALAGASTSLVDANELVVTTVEFRGRVVIAQVPQTDARYHPDVKKLPKAIFAQLGAEWTELPANRRSELASLFLPVILAEEVDAALSGFERGHELRAIICKTSTFWSEAKLVSSDASTLPYAEGEIFFEALDGYRLNHIN